MNGFRTPGCEPRRLRFVATLTPFVDGYVRVLGIARNINEFSRLGKTYLRTSGKESRFAYSGVPFGCTIQSPKCTGKVMQIS